MIARHTHGFTYLSGELQATDSWWERWPQTNKARGDAQSPRAFLCQGQISADRPPLDVPRMDSPRPTTARRLSCLVLRDMGPSLGIRGEPTW